MDTSALGPPISNGNEIEDPNNPVVKQIEADLGDDPGSQAVRRALSQLGVPYVYEGESPGQAFDCFGLTNWACGRAGESLPRTAAEQQSACTPVSMNQLKPGDLLFYGQPAHHVTMYVGHGMMVEAPHTGERVRLVPVRPPTSAGRPHS
jgi:cell wall-associated NlpC family hydrolase